MSEVNEFILPVTRLVFIAVLTLCLGVLRRARVSNTAKLLLSIAWTVFFLRVVLYFLDRENTLRFLDPVVTHIIKSEISAYYQWFLERYYVLTTFGLAFATSRFIDALRI